ncbi:glycosyltransferase family 2 protein [Cohnella abietis]|uniref:Biofilm formation protein PslC n=1 Tax=Cohnella abietis TaxID=2507935 RepID=A0A3T1DDK4_9BACL|nr:glycosyltransferase [Cohnella abietis]BBI36172.1 biofilm formation protein PslC [Cohnella abietis]
MEFTIQVSVIIPTLNAASYLNGLLTRLLDQSVVLNEIIVVDSMSNDNTIEVAQRLGATVLSIDRSSFDHGATRNFAASHAKGDILVYITQDALPSGYHFIEELIAPFEDSQVVAAYGRQVARPEADPIERMTREFNYSMKPIRKSMADVNRYGIKTFFFTNVCSAMRKDFFDKVGGFPEPIISNEDMIFAAKCILQGYSIVYTPKASVVHSHHFTLMQQFRRHFDIGVSLRMNEWLFQYAKPEGEGVRLIKTQLKHLMTARLWMWIPRWAAETVVKYSGYRLGLSYKRIPRKMLKKCSMQRSFW